MKNAKSSKSVSNSFAAVVDTLKGHRLAATSDDMHKVLGLGKAGSCFEYTESVHATVKSWGIDTSSVFAIDRNPKVIKRFIQFVHGVNAKSYKHIDKTTATIIYALSLTKGSSLTVDAIHYLAAGLAEGRIAPETKGISKRTLGRLFGSIGLSTIPTQCSRTVGKNGFLQLVGATKGEPGKHNQSVSLDESHPMIQAFFATMTAATEGQITELVGDAA